jgi:hypothetical protein
MAQSLKPMKAEVKKSYQTGFALTESELRRFHEVLVQQIKKTPIGDDFVMSYELKYRNGAVSYPTSIDDVLAQENFGSVGILRFRIEVADKEEKPSNMIGVQFCNLDEDDWYLYPISSVVLGEDRDWVFLTSSQLDERIGKTRLFSLSRFISGNRESMFRLILFTLFPLLLFGLVLMSLTFASNRQDHQAVVQLDALESRWKAGTLKDSAEVAIQTAQIIIRRGDASATEILWPIGIGILIIAVVVLFSLCYKYFQPSYNFLWGDYVDDYEKRKSRGRLILVSVILATVVGIGVSFISKRIGL